MNQNWDITESDDNEIFFANSQGLLMFNGSRWTLFDSPNGSILRSVKFINDKVYAGMYEDFGYWQKKIDGSFDYKSIVTLKNLNIEDDEEFWNILHYDDWIVFQSYSRFIMYNEKSADVKYFVPSEDIINSYNLEDRIFFMLSSGLYTLENNKQLLVSNDFNVKPTNEHPHNLNIFKKQREIILINSEMGIFRVLNDGLLKELKKEGLDSEEDLTVYKAIQLKNGDMAIGTVGKGLMIFDKNANLIHQIDKTKGLNNNTILSLYEDKNNNIWMGLDNGISLLNLDSPFKIYSDDSGILGTVYASKLYKGNLYIGTNQGLFYKPDNSSSEFTSISNTSGGQVWSLVEIDGTLFCGHDNGTYVIKENVASKISKTSGSWTYRKLPNSNLILEGGYLGFNILHKPNKNWVVRNKIKGFDISSRLFEISSNGKVIVSHGYKGVYKLLFNKNFDELKEVLIDTSVSIGGNASLAKFDNQIYYNYSEGFYKYIDEKDVFVRDTLLSELSNKELINGIIINDNNKKMWMFSKNYIHYLSKDLMSDERKVRSIVFEENLRKTVFENISKIKNDQYIIGTNNGYVSFDLNKYNLKTPSVKVDRVHVNEIGKAGESVAFDQKLQFNYKSNNVTFDYSSSNFKKFKPVKYQYFLEGYMNEWSELSEKSSVSFSNLRYGTYNFNVRSKIGNLLSKDVESVELKIERPWFLSNFMIINYALALAGLFYLTNNYYTNFYRRKEEKIMKRNKSKLELKEFEKKQALMSIENEKLQQDIEGKNRELAISTMSMLKKNKFLSRLKFELKKIESSPKIKTVINTIDRNLNNQDDWKFFEQAFNNADKDFLRKVKKTHPELTNNDLRLCAYLRLNLSSKEIAPLLNISLSSVEIKRYRLRKKMNLSRNQGLTDHILSL
ncbi:MAG: LuxR family transcriptional regulator [Flavobacteriaceae bacterium]|nr:LuxR family transcriptional regulator [Flavobacteriaceae bacterium]